MKIDKVYNNNVVQIREDSGEEAIVMGKGIGFQKKVGDELDLSKIEKKFVLEDSNIANELSRVYVDLSNEEIEAVFDIIKHAQEGLGVTFETSLYISLADHLHFTLIRLKDNLAIDNPLGWEVRKFFPKEFQLAKDAIEILEKKLGTRLPEDEAASIALHFINAEKDAGMVEKNYQLSKTVADILDIVRLYYGTSFDEESVSYNRFVTHVRYFVQRVLNGSVQGKNDSFLYEQVKLNYPEAFICTQRIKDYVESRFDFPMSRDEQVYLTIHIQRLEASK